MPVAASEPSVDRQESFSNASDPQSVGPGRYIQQRWRSTRIPLLHIISLPVGPGFGRFSGWSRNIHRTRNGSSKGISTWKAMEAECWPARPAGKSNEDALRQFGLRWRSSIYQLFQIRKGRQGQVCYLKGDSIFGLDICWQKFHWRHTSQENEVEIEDEWYTLRRSLVQRDNFVTDWNRLNGEQMAMLLLYQHLRDLRHLRHLRCPQ